MVNSLHDTPSAAYVAALATQRDRSLCSRNVAGRQGRVTCGGL